MTAHQLAVALNTISPNGPWNIKEKDGVVSWIWKGDELDKPTEQELQDIWSSIGYRFVREYPRIQDQLDTLWHDIDNGLLGENAKTGEWFTSIKAVKDSSPKISE